MKIEIATQDEKLDIPVFDITIPDNLIKTMLLEFSKLISIQEDTPEDKKQALRSTRMLVKSALLLTGDSIRSALDIYGKPAKKDDVIEWYVTNIVNSIVECISKQTVVLRTEVQDENAFVTEVHTKSI